MIHITAHAVIRYQERVANVSDEIARERLASPTIRQAVDFGAPYVRLGTGQQVVIVDSAIVTVLPSDHTKGLMGRDGDRRREGH